MAEKFTPQRVIAIVLLAAILFGSLFVLSDKASSPETYARSIAALDEKKATVVGLTATTAAASIAVAAVPGDATSPIADQIAELSSYLLVVTGVIMLEEFLLTLTGYLTFTWLLPIACGLGILYLLLQIPYLKRLALRLALFGLAICMVIPVSVKIGTMFEETFDLMGTIEQAEQASENAQEDADDSAQQQNQQTGLGGFFSQIGEAVTGAVGTAVESAKNVLNRFINAVAVLVISNCVIPVLVLFVFLELVKAVLPQSVSGAIERAVNSVQEARGRRGRRIAPDTKPGAPAVSAPSPAPAIPAQHRSETKT